MSSLSSIFSCVCTEKEGSVIRHVYPMILTPENLKKFWEKSKPFKFLFNTEIRENFDCFLNMFVNQIDDKLHGTGLFWVVDDFVGVFYITEIMPEEDCQAHITFFDRRFNGRLHLTKKMLIYLFDKYQFKRISVSLPKYATDSSRRFLASLGFTYEGRKRQATEFNGERYDVDLFSILASEVNKPVAENNKWEVQRLKLLVERLTAQLQRISRLS